MNQAGSFKPQDTLRTSMSSGTELSPFVATERQLSAIDPHEGTADPIEWLDKATLGPLKFSRTGRDFY